MQTKLVNFTMRLCLTVAVLGGAGNALALDPNVAVKVTQLMKTTTTWEGKPIAYPRGKAEVTAMRVEVAPGGETGWHAHSVPSFAVMLEGTLEVTLKDGRVKKLQAGDVLAEVVNTPHNGRNVGAVPVRLVVFYTGLENRGHTMRSAQRD